MEGWKSENIHFNFFLVKKFNQLLKVCSLFHSSKLLVVKF